MEGVDIDPRRVRLLLNSARPLFRDRDEEEVRGYREALSLIHENAARLEISEETIRRLHRLSRGQVWDAGRYKEKDSNIIERHPNGRRRIRFCTVPATETPRYMAQLVSDWQSCQEDRWIHPLIALASFNLDFLCIHPEDGLSGVRGASRRYAVPTRFQNREDIGRLGAAPARIYADAA